MSLMRKYFCSFLILVCLSSAFSVPLVTRGVTQDELRQKITNKTEEIRKLEEEIKKYQTQINVLGSEKTTLAKLIRSLELTRKKLETDIRVTRAKVEATTLEIDQLNSKISLKEREIGSRREAISEMIRLMYERDNPSLPEVILSKDTLSSFWNDIESLEQFNEGVQENLLRLKSYKSELEVAQEARATEKQKLMSFKEELGDRKKIVENNKEEKAELLRETSNQESNYKKILSKTIATKEAFERELEEYESTLKYILDPSLIPPRGINIFSPPLDSIYITQRFGKTSAARRLYVSGSHNGVDFRAPMGTPVRAMATGTVVGSGNTDLACHRTSYGNWVLIRYDNGLASTYGHLSLVKEATAGQTVKAGDVVAYSGNSGYSTGPHLHVSLYPANAVSINDLPSKSCGGKILTLPLAATNAYLDLLDYLIID